jgi:hypothetical protein
MIAKRISVALLVFGAWLILAPQALGANAPAWKISAIPLPTNFSPGAVGTTDTGPMYSITATNVGAAPAKAANPESPITLSATLPPGIVPGEVPTLEDGDPGSPDFVCATAGQEVTCTTPGPLQSGKWLGAWIPVTVTAAPGLLSAEVSISGGGAPEARTTAPTRVDPAPAPFDFLSAPLGLSAPLTGSDGSPMTQAGSHPYQLTVDLGFSVAKTGNGELAGSGHLHDQVTELPPGLVGNPAATPELCSEAQLASATHCPLATQVGTITATTSFGSGPTYFIAPLYNMVPPPGAPAELAFDPVGVGIFTHLIASVRSDGDYGISTTVSDFLARPLNPVLGAVAQIWGDPSAASHDRVRGSCGHPTDATELCPVQQKQKTPFLTMPSACSGPSTTGAQADTWEEPGTFKEAQYESADLAGNPTGVSGCNQLRFEPSISSQPTTNLVDSPSGLDFDLKQPQTFDLKTLSTAALKDATVTLPAGMAVNPSQGDGLGACSAEQIGLSTAVGETPIHFDTNSASCPDAAKLGTLEVKSPLLSQYVSEHRTVVDPNTGKPITVEEATKLRRNPETGNPIPDPLNGSVYLAKPFENPFGSLLAIYLVIDDAKTGIVAKLAGKVEPDPVTGQLRTRFEENPQLPLEDVKLHLFGGARGSLITPSTCGAYATTSELTPWSTPEGLDATPEDSFETTTAPDGGACSSAESQAPNKPVFTAGTIAPAAGAYSPFVLKLSREDGSQRLAGIDATLPPGLSGKLAGIVTCSEAQIAAAKAREKPNQGVLEQQSPSCPASSEVGTVDVGAGAGPTPLHVQGHAYLAGPYKGAPLSLAIITPAVAGPFDLGAVVVRTALYVNPETAQIHAVSDPLPQILDGIPLDVRSIALRMGRPQFTLNPTSCDPMAIGGSATSSLGQSAALTSPFQVGGCASLPFKPKLSLKLKGGTKRASHPKLIATLKAKPGEAGIASTSVQLPRSAFLDQAHIRTVCTRVQFAANACPEGSIYGEATATTPLLDYPLSGNVYLRSSNNKLPDLVVALKGPASQPIEIDLDGRTDSVKGALRNSFEAVPDAPVSSFRLELFGGKRGLVINSRDLCKHAYKALVVMEGQNGKSYDTTPLVSSDCGKGQRKGRHHGHGHAH